MKARKAVILCTGPFDFNDEMVRNYLRPYPMKFAGWKFNTGDGIPMATRVGARLWHMNGLCGYYCPWFEEGKAGPLAQSYTTWLPAEMGGAPAFSNDNSEEIAKGWIIKGDTLEKLAEKTGMDAGNLKEEIDQINKAVTDGKPNSPGYSKMRDLHKKPETCLLM